MSARIIEIMRTMVGLEYPDERFRAHVEPYWTKGYGTTCMVAVTGALEKAGVPGKYINRGPGHWTPGDHLGAMMAFARSIDAFRSGDPSELRPGDIYFLERVKTDGADHLGVIEENHGDYLITLDGGQKGKNGDQSIGRVKRFVHGNMITGPNGLGTSRPLKWWIDSEKFINEATRERKKPTMDSAAIRSFLRQVNAEWEATDDAIAAANAAAWAGGPPLTFKRSDFESDSNQWRRWYAEQIDDWWIDDDVYDAAIEWQKRARAWQAKLPKSDRPDIPLPPSPKSNEDKEREEEDKSREFSANKVILGTVGIIAAAGIAKAVISSRGM